MPTSISIAATSGQHAPLEKRDSQQSSLSSNGSQQLENNCSGDLSLLSSNAADYDRIKNTTLMFFLDRLFIASKDGKEARTLHDLSCLFGTRDFTREMRQIVGASRNGLKKFLQSYPSLFTIEGDKVYLTQLRQEATIPVRDYNNEAVAYFTQKLEQFGPSLVPIKNLFGYRSQASQEVRHVSGKNAREFKLFLRQHEDVFELLADDHVILKSALKELEARGESHATIKRIATMLSQDGDCSSFSGEHSNLGAAVMDPYLNKQFAALIEDCLRNLLNQAEVETVNEDAKQKELKSNNNKVGLEFLHKRILADCQNPVFLKMVETIEDFKVFLRMHPKIFKRISSDNSTDHELDYVTLLTADERRELELQAYPLSSGFISRQHSTLERSTSGQPVSLPPLHSLTSPASSGQIGASSSSTLTATNKQQTTITNKLPEAKQSTSEIKGPSSALRANAPPFVPSPRSKLQASLSTATSTRPTTQVQRSLSSLSSTTNHNQNHITARQTQDSRGAPMDPKQTLRSHLMRASMENSANGLYAPSKQSNGALSRNNNNILVSNNNINNSEDLRARTVDIVREASNIISRIMNTAEAVAFDCKGYNLGFNGQITLIQFGFLPTKNQSSSTIVSTNDENYSKYEQSSPKQKPEVCIFDLITNPELAYCLKPLLESDQIVKIVHDVRNKSNALHVQFGIMLNHVFDTQVANLVIQQQETGKPAHKSRYISMSKLCEIYGDDSLVKYRNLIKSKTRHSNSSGSNSNSKLKDVNYWRTRPLTDAMIYESTLDVYCLVGGIHQNLKSRIKPEYEPLFEQLNLEGVLARIKPEEIRSVKKERKIDLEVIELKRKLYTESTGSIVLSNREIRLLRHIDLSEEVRSKIQHCKKVVKKLERLDMKAAQQSMLSMNSDNVDQSLDLMTNASINSNAYSSNSSHSSTCNSTGNQQQEETTAQSLPLISQISDEVVAVDELMDGSMFDEFKDKMIESSGLLESLEEDDDDDEDAMRSIQAAAAALTGSSTGSQHQFYHHHHHHSQSKASTGEPASVGSDCCSCQCHSNSPRSSLTTQGEKLASLKSTSTSTSTSTSMEHNNDDENDCDSNGSKVVDMAVQCDLLS